MPIIKYTIFIFYFLKILDALPFSCFLSLKTTFVVPFLVLEWHKELCINLTMWTILDNKVWLQQSSQQIEVDYKVQEAKGLMGP